MAFSLPSAIGAATANPDKRVVTIVGDGGFQMCLNELGTIKQEGLKIGIALFNNNRLGMVRELQEHYCGARYSAVHLECNPDFSKIAAAYDVEYILVDDNKQIESAVKMLLDPKKIVLVEFVIDPNANVIPVKAGE